MLTPSTSPEPGTPIGPAQLARFIDRMRSVREGEERLAMLLQAQDQGNGPGRDIAAGSLVPMLNPWRAALSLVRACAPLPAGSGIRSPCAAPDWLRAAAGQGQAHPDRSRSGLAGQRPAHPYPCGRARQRRRLLIRSLDLPVLDDRSPPSSDHRNIHVWRVISVAPTCSHCPDLSISGRRRAARPGRTARPSPRTPACRTSRKDSRTPRS